MENNTARKLLDVMPVESKEFLKSNRFEKMGSSVIEMLRKIKEKKQINDNTSNIKGVPR